MEHIKIPKVDNVRLVNRHGSGRAITGSLYITTSHLIFMDPPCSKETWVLHMHIASVEKLPLTAAGCPIRIACKTFHVLNFVLPRERDCTDVVACLNKLSQPDKIENLYAFQYRHLDGIPKMRGWDFFDLRSEFLRMGAPNKHWALSKLNYDYELCDTYPRWIYVPSSATTPMIYGSCKFRSRGRLPALSYLHRNNQAVICRCSQPLAGFSARCIEDEQLFHTILKANPKSKTLHVVDTRPKLNALANKAGGKGYESESFYTNIKFKFVGIENIHIMRSSLEKLIEISDGKSLTMNSFLTSLESSSWLKHIRAVLDTSLYIARKVERGESVVVHCSDGWDRTAQTCSIASIILDPYYRTIEGFQALIEKEWLSFGHKFTDRCRLVSTGSGGESSQKEQSPVFTQFLDATWQLLCQYPCSFQFNERFLLTLHDHVYSCQFGTFIGNCEKDRIDLRLSERTYSLWGYLATRTSDYLNPLYRKDRELEEPVLRPHAGPQFIRYWKGLYNRFEKSLHEKESVVDVVSSLKEQSTMLEDHIKLLEKRVHSLANALGKPVEDISQKLHGLLSDESIYCLSALLNTSANGTDKVGTDSSQENPSKHGSEPRESSSFGKKVNQMSDRHLEEGTSEHADSEQVTQSAHGNSALSEQGAHGNSALSEQVAQSAHGNSALSEQVTQSADGNSALSEQVTQGAHGNSALSEQGAHGNSALSEQVAQGAHGNSTIAGSDSLRSPASLPDVVVGSHHGKGLVEAGPSGKPGAPPSSLSTGSPRGGGTHSATRAGDLRKGSDDAEDTESGFEDGASQWSKSQLLSFDEANSRGSFMSFKEASVPVSIDSIREEMSSVSVSWQSLRVATQCVCAAPFEHFSRKYHCWKCGHVHCERCVGQQLQLSGLSSGKPVPVCKTCYKAHKRSTPPRISDSATPLAAVSDSEVKGHVSVEDAEPDVVASSVSAEVVTQEDGSGEGVTGAGVTGESAGEMSTSGYRDCSSPVISFAGNASTPTSDVSYHVGDLSP